MGAGQGAVGLMMAGAIHGAHITSLEVQALSFELLKKNIAANDLSQRFELIHGDLRDFEGGGPPFDLITGTPPFMPPGTGTPPNDPQRRAARFELHGGIEDYCEAASRLLAPGGTLVIVMDAARPERYQEAFRQRGLHVHRQLAVCPKPERPPTYLIYWAGHDARPALPHLESLAVRGPKGEFSEDFLRVRRTLDLPA